MTSRSEATNPLLASALRYAGRGWPVFPLRPGAKTPLTQTGFKEAVTDEAQVRAWWKQWPSANIGLATGHAFDVLDIDGHVGVERLRTFLKDRGAEYYFHPGPVSVTGKGWHCLFAPTGRGNGAALLGPDSKIDFRGLGGYIVAPPSLHPDGHSYHWDARRQDGLDLPSPPDWLTALLDRVATQPTAAPKPVIVPGIDAATLRAMDRQRTLDVESAALQVRKDFRSMSIIEACAEKGITLQPRGPRFVGLCPYHEESTPSLTIYPANDTFYCYGCGVYGDSADLMAGTHFAAEQAKR